jgi:hypothetical protein
MIQDWDDVMIFFLSTHHSQMHIVCKLIHLYKWILGRIARILFVGIGSILCKLVSIWPIFGEFCSCHSIFRAPCDLLLGRGRSKKKNLCLNLNHIIPKVGIKQFDRGTNNDSKTSHTWANFGNMMLLPKIGKTERVLPLQALGWSSSGLPQGEN